MNSVLATIVVATIATAVFCDDVPVLIWSSDRSSASFPPPYAGHRVTGDEFTRDYLERIIDAKSIYNVAVFIEEQLSVEYLRDIYADNNDDERFFDLRATMDSSSGIVLPAVTSPVDELLSSVVPAWNGSVHDFSGPSYALPVGEIGSVPQLFIIELPLEQTGRDSDSVLNVVTSQLESLGKPFLCLYTSHHARPNPLLEPQFRGEGPGSQGNQRRLLQTEIYDDQNFLFVNLSNCLYFYVENITFTLPQNSWSLPLNPSVNPESFCANYSAQLTLDFNVGAELKSLSMTMVFAQTLGVNAGYWYMSNFTVTYLIDDGTTAYTDAVDIFPFFVTETPFGLSYSCSYLPQIPNLNISKTGRGTNITFNQLQIQAFDITNNEFGYYNDCVGFFNITIWTCLIVIFILLIILADGVCMMMSLETADRYDDPKGKLFVTSAIE